MELKCNGCHSHRPHREGGSLGLATPAPSPTAAIANQSQALLTQPPALGIVSRTGPQTTSELTRETPGSATVSPAPLLRPRPPGLV